MKKTIRTAILVTIVLFVVKSLQAQQPAQYSLWQFNQHNFNPAYAGMQESPYFTALVRQQWVGLEGAPESQLLTFNMPLTSIGIGLGGQVSRHAIGATERLTAEASYAYRFKLGRGGRLGIGLSTSIRYLKVNFDETVSTQPASGDPAIPDGVQSKYVPNFGAGLYYSNQKFYVGFSAPRLLTNNIDLSDDSSVISKEVPHYYMMAGLLVQAGSQLQIQPQFLLKYIEVLSLF